MYHVYTRLLLLGLNLYLSTFSKRLYLFKSLRVKKKLKILKYNTFQTRLLSSVARTRFIGPKSMFL